MEKKHKEKAERKRIEFDDGAEEDYNKGLGFDPPYLHHVMFYIMIILYCIHLL